LFDRRPGTVNIFAVQHRRLVRRDYLAVVTFAQTSGNKLHGYFTQLSSRLVPVEIKPGGNDRLSRRRDWLEKFSQDFVLRSPFRRICLGEHSRFTDTNVVDPRANQSRRGAAFGPGKFPRDEDALIVNAFAWQRCVNCVIVDPVHFAQ